METHVTRQSPEKPKPASPSLSRLYPTLHAQVQFRARGDARYTSVSRKAQTSQSISVQIVPDFTRSGTVPSTWRCTLHVGFQQSPNQPVHHCSDCTRLYTLWYTPEHVEMHVTRQFPAKPKPASPSLSGQYPTLHALVQSRARDTREGALLTSRHPQSFTPATPSLFASSITSRPPAPSRTPGTRKVNFARQSPQKPNSTLRYLAPSMLENAAWTQPKCLDHTSQSISVRTAPDVTRCTGSSVPSTWFRGGALLICRQWHRTAAGPAPLLHSLAWKVCTLHASSLISFPEQLMPDTQALTLPSVSSQSSPSGRSSSRPSRKPSCLQATRAS